MVSAYDFPPSYTVLFGVFLCEAEKLIRNRRVPSTESTSML